MDTTIELVFWRDYLFLMEFEWDEAKRQENLRRARVDFSYAVRIFGDPKRIDVADDRKDYGEARRQVIGQIDGRSYVVAYTMRGPICRIITAWRLGIDGERRYQALLARRDQADE